MKLGQTVQTEINNQVELLKNNQKGLQNLLELIKSDSFFKLNDAVIQLLLIYAFSNRPEDKVFREVIVSLAGKSDFKDFNTAVRAKVITDLDTFANTASYTSNSNPTDDDKTFLLEKIRKTSIFSGKDSTNVVIRNTLDNLINGTVPIELIAGKSITCGKSGNGTIFGCNIPGSKIVYINKDANDAEYRDFIETLCHETNHALNNNVTSSYVVDIFLNEYRAHIAGKVGRGEMLTAALVKEFLNKLGRDKSKTPDSYQQINDFYEDKKFPQFKVVIDQAYKDADKGTIVNALEMRKRLIAAKFGTPYITGTNNTDNR